MANMLRGAERKNSQHLRFEEFVPSSSWTEDSDTHCLIIDLPGFKRDEMNLKVDNNECLVACGERQGNENKRIRFEQSYKVPENSSIEDTTAKFEDEILFIVIPKIIKAQKEPHPEITNVAEAVQEEKGTGLDVVDKVPHAVLKEEDVKGKNQHTDAAANSSRHESESASHNHHGNEEISDEESEEENHDDTEEEEEEEEETAVKTTTEEDFLDAKMDSQSSLMEKLRRELKKNKGILITAVLAFSLGVIVSQKFQPNEK